MTAFRLLSDQPSPRPPAPLAAKHPVKMSHGGNNIRLWSVEELSEKVPGVEPINRTVALDAWQFGGAWAATVLTNLLKPQSPDLESAIGETQRLAEKLKVNLPELAEMSGNREDDLLWTQHVLRVDRDNLYKQLKSRCGEREAQYFQLAACVQQVPLVVSMKHDRSTKQLVSALKFASECGEVPEKLWKPLVEKLEAGATTSDIRKTSSPGLNRF